MRKIIMIGLIAIAFGACKKKEDNTPVNATNTVTTPTNSKTVVLTLNYVPKPPTATQGITVKWYWPMDSSTMDSVYHSNSGLITKTMQLTNDSIGFMIYTGSNYTVNVTSNGVSKFNYSSTNIFGSQHFISIN
jgi:hypothetical protein